MRINNADMRIAYEVSYESFLAGALLVLPSVDIYDRRAICEEFAVELRGYSYLEKLYKYINIDDNKTVSLKNGLTLDSVLEEGCTVRKKLTEIAGNEVLRYFQKFNIERHRDTKQRVLAAKQEIIDKSGVLLIAENEDMYDKLCQYGFKNIDYFKSLIRADKYFQEHPDELKKYHFILTGKLSARKCTSDFDVSLDKTIRILEHENAVVIRRYDEYSIFNVDDIIDCAYSMNTLQKVGYQGEFKLIEDVVMDSLPLPTKKGDLKILFLDDLGMAETEKIMSLVRNMGLNVTFVENINSTLGKVAKYKLGEYDIIIAGKMYSSNLINMTVESTEQCKDTGRELTLLVTYSDYEYSGSNDISVTLRYAYAGNLAPQITSEPVTADEFRVLGETGERELKIFTAISAILSASVNIYNKCLPTPLTDLDFKSSSDYEKEYKDKEEKEKAEMIEARNAISAFDNMVEIINNYLECRRSGLIERNPRGKEIIEKSDGLRIICLGNGIKLENYRQGEMNFALAFPLKKRNDKCRVFSIKIKDSDYESASLYVEEQKGGNIPPKISERQLKILTAFEKLVEESMLLLPLKTQESHERVAVKK